MYRYDGMYSRDSPYARKQIFDFRLISDVKYNFASIPLLK